MPKQYHRSMIPASQLDAKMFWSSWWSVDKDAIFLSLQLGGAQLPLYMSLRSVPRVNPIPHSLPCRATAALGQLAANQYTRLHEWVLGWLGNGNTDGMGCQGSGKQSTGISNFSWQGHDCELAWNWLHSNCSACSSNTDNVIMFFCESSRMALTPYPLC